MNNFKKRWEITSNYQVIVIIIVFAITGSSSVFVGNYILNILAITKDNYLIIWYYLLKIILVFIIYQILLLFFGTLFGQLKFFCKFEKKMLKQIGLGFIFESKKNPE